MSFSMNFINNRKILTRLTSLFLVQLLLIFAFVLFGAFVSNNVDVSEPWSGGNVKFISKASHSSFAEKTHQQYSTPTFMRIVKNDNFHNQFIITQEEVQISVDIAERIMIKKVCFKEGIQQSNKLNRASQDVNNKTEDYSELSACSCAVEWHGHTCSEPEIIRRAFMASRQPMKQSPTITKHPHNIFYIVNGISSINVETLEIQLLELIGVVNLLIICDLIKTEDPSLLMKHQMNKGFLHTYRDYVLLLKDETCSSANIYQKMKQIIGLQMRPSDLVLNGHSDEILNRKAINYLKWHNNWPQPLRFRLRWNVYGFFFQHPENTIISSVACQLNVLEQFYKSDPDKILANHQSPTVVTVGDLNHYGGWFCEYCYQPIDIIRKLHIDSKLITNNSRDPLKKPYHRKPIINIGFIQNLIQYGLYIDGKLELHKLRHYQDTKYFTPETVAKNRWKFDNIVTNFYSSWDDDLDVDY